MRRYNADKTLAPLPHKLTPTLALVPELGELKAWEDGQLLHDLREASQILTAKLGSGYSYNELRQAIKNQWQEKVHYWKKGRRYKVNLHRVIQSQLS